jgi:hypothetical protein
MTAVPDMPGWQTARMRYSLDGIKKNLTLILLSHKNSTWGIFLYINHKV